MHKSSPPRPHRLNGYPVITLQKIRIAVTIGKFFQKTRREKKIGLHSVSIQSGIPMNLLVQIESGNILSIKKNAEYIDHITNMIAKNLHVNIDEYYPSKPRLTPLETPSETIQDPSQ